MADGFIKVPVDSTGKALDTSELTVNGQTVERERVVSADPTDALALTKVTNATPGANDYGTVTRNIPSGTQPVSDGGGSLTVDGTVTANAGAGPFPVSDNGGSLTVDGTVAVSGSVAVTGPLTDAQLRAAVVPISDGAGSLTVDAPVGTPVFTRLSDGAASLIGQKAMAASLPVVVASDQSAIPVTATALTDGTQKAIVRGGAKGATTAADLTGTAEGADHQALDVQIMHGGAAKDPTQIRALTNADVVKAQLQDNAGTAVTVGQKAMASSLPVTMASDQPAIPISAASLPLPAGAATAAKQDTGNTSLGSIDGKLTTAATVPTPTDTGLVVRPALTTRTAGPTALNALNAAVTIDMDGMAGAGFFVGATTMVGTIVAETSADGGTTWSAASILNAASVAWSLTGVTPSAGTEYTVLVSSTARKLRVRVSAFTSGSAAVTMVASATISPLALSSMLAIAGITSPLFLQAVCGVDGSGLARALQLRAADALTTDYGLAVRQVDQTLESTGTLGALNATVTLATKGRPWVGVTLTNSQAINATLVIEHSTDGGVVWDIRYFFNGDSWGVGDLLPNTNGIVVRTYSLAMNPADTHVRVRAYAYTSGSVTAVVRASATTDAALTWIDNIDALPVALGALNATQGAPVIGLAGIGFHVLAGTLAGTLVVEYSADDGATWVSVPRFYDQSAWVTSKVLTNPNPPVVINVPMVAAYTHIRLRVSAYTSGSAVARARSSNTTDTMALHPSAGIAGNAVPPLVTALGGTDSSTLRALNVANRTPLSSEYGLITRDGALGRYDAVLGDRTVIELLAAIERALRDNAAADVLNTAAIVANKPPIPVSSPFMPVFSPFIGGRAATTPAAKSTTTLLHR